MGAVDFENLIYGAEWILDMVRHEHTPLEIDHQRAQAVTLPSAPTPSRRTGWIIRRPDQGLFAFQIRIYLFFLPYVISRRQNIDASGHQFFGALNIDAHAS